MQVEAATVRSILTRTSGYLDGIASHSIQPYRGCSLGRSLCGVGCYVQHARHLMKGRDWGSFLEARTNAAEAYLGQVDRERRWARKSRGRFGIFFSSATEPFPPQEDRWGISGSVLSAMLDEPPDLLIVQTHSHRVAGFGSRLVELSRGCEVRVHLSIETDRDRLPGLPGHASAVDRRFEASRALRDSGLFVVVTVAPLLPIAEPDRFFARIAEVADAVVLDHYIGGDGSASGSRTLRTGLPGAMAAVDPESVSIAYRDRMAGVAGRHLPGRVGLGRDGFSGRFG